MSYYANPDELNYYSSAQSDSSNLAYTDPNPNPSGNYNFYDPNAHRKSFPSHSNSNVNNDLMSTMNTNNATTNTSGTVDYDNEPPLLEELGINPAEILQKTVEIVFPFVKSKSLQNNTGNSNSNSSTSSNADNADLCGPLLYCLLYGTLLLLGGKIHFGYIYGFGMVGTIMMYIILNLMADNANQLNNTGNSYQNSQNNANAPNAPPTSNSISLDRCLSICGYSMFPLVFLSFFCLFFNVRASFMGIFMILFFILWSAFSACRGFEVTLAMREQRYLIAYPALLLYACFALLTIF